MSCSLYAGDSEIFLFKSESEICQKAAEFVTGEVDIERYSRIILLYSQRRFSDCRNLIIEIKNIVKQDPQIEKRLAFWKFYYIKVLWKLEKFDKGVKYCKILKNTDVVEEALLIMQFYLYTGKGLKFIKLYYRFSNLFTSGVRPEIGVELNFILLQYYFSEAHKHILPVKNAFSDIELNKALVDYSKTPLVKYTHDLNYLIYKGKYLDMFHRDIEAELHFHNILHILKKIHSEYYDYYQFLGHIIYQVFKHYKNLNTLSKPMSEILQYLSDNNINDLFNLNSKLKILSSLKFYKELINKQENYKFNTENTLKLLIKSAESSPYSDPYVISKAYRALAVISSDDYKIRVNFLKMSLNFHEKSSNYSKSFYNKIFQLLLMLNKEENQHIKARKYLKILEWDNANHYINSKREKKTSFIKQLSKTIHEFQIKRLSETESNSNFQLNQVIYLKKYRKEVKCQELLIHDRDSYIRLKKFYTDLAPYARNMLKILGTNEITSRCLYFESSYSDLHEGSNFSIALSHNFLSLINYLIALKETNYFIGNLNPSHIVFDKFNNIKYQLIDKIDPEYREIGDKHSNVLKKYICKYPYIKNSFYTAPEFAKIDEYPEEEYIDCTKVDVFSIGMIILEQIYKISNSDSLRDKLQDKTETQIFDIINTLHEFEWIKSLLKGMVRNDVKERLSVFEIVKRFKTTYQIYAESI